MIIIMIICLQLLIVHIKEMCLCCNRIVKSIITVYATIIMFSFLNWWPSCENLIYRTAMDNKHDCVIWFPCNLSYRNNRLCYSPLAISLDSYGTTIYFVFSFIILNALFLLLLIIIIYKIFIINSHRCCGKILS